MALFGRNKAQERYQEAKKLTDLVYDWLLQPLRQYNFSASDGVQTEYYLLAICSYLAREKVSSGAREHLHTAVVESSTYGKKYVKDRQKEYGFMAVLQESFKSEEKSARRAGGNVLAALVKQCFRDFSKYDEPEKVRRCVHNTINLFNEEIPTTDYAKLRLPVPAAARPSASTAASANTPVAKVGNTKIVMMTPEQERQARNPDYVLTDKDGKPAYFNKRGGVILFGSASYQTAVNQDNQDNVIFLNITDGRPILVNDPGLLSSLLLLFTKKNPDFKFKDERPEFFNLVNSSTGQRKRVNVLGWVDHWGKTYAITRWYDGSGGIVVLDWAKGNEVVGLDSEDAQKIFLIFRAQNPGMFK